ncbi:MAG: hypothetical protein LBT51_09130 [Fusobacteriaceae bacterium]|jgi:energy-coupling factor transporter ATP-binding protein EcfA2|nr:hypothetical protein [Fusobacteriaceae bacterium]
MSYEKFSKGSEWRKWDLHIHTPGTAKNDNFSSHNDVWDQYIAELEKSDIDVFGITDYFSMENYLKVKSFQDESRLKDKFIIPNVELRILPVTDNKRLINLHIFFDPNLEYGDIEREFFREMEFKYKDATYACIREDLIKLGRSYKSNQNLEEPLAYKEGIGQYNISISCLQKILSNDCLKGRYLVGVANSSKDGNSGIQDSSLAAIRKEIYRLSNFVFSANKNDIKYFIGQGRDNIEKIIQDYGSLKPCIVGSDAHSFDEIANKFTWIKANTTFEGLKQILCEPVDRVKIQEDEPEQEQKKNYNVIEKIKFVDESGEKRFTDKEIGFSRGLNAIIGGKSSGKSLLLNLMAKAIGNKTDTNKDKDYSALTEGVTLEIYYADDTNKKRTPEDKRIIEFLPQLHIEKIVSNNKSLDRTDFNKFVKDLIRETDVTKLYNKHEENISQAKSKLDNSIKTWLELDRKLSDKKAELDPMGDKIALEKEIKRIKNSIEELTKKSGLNDKELTKYNDLTKKNTELDSELDSNKEYKDELERLKKYVNSSFEFYQPSIFESNLERIKEKVNNFGEKIKALITAERKNFATELDEETKELEKKLSDNTQKKEKNNEQLKPLLEKNKIQSDIEKLSADEKKENLKVVAIEQKEKEISELKEQRNNIEFIEFYNEIEKSYKELSASIKDIIGKQWIRGKSNLTLEPSLVFDSAKFVDTLGQNINMKTYLENQFKDSGFTEQEYKYSDNHSENIRKILDKLTREDDRFNNFKSNGELKPLLRALFADNYYIDFDIKKGNDSLQSMSEGKKGIVVLQLYLSLSKADCPILIDQPEDNLDNRTVYTELNDYIKECKKHRQIIMVSHNANLVVNTDAENVIIANQQGEDGKENKEYKFEYVNGAIEETFKNEEEKGILYQKGIREHVCEILEGGLEAFKKREKKYDFLE